MQAFVAQDPGLDPNDLMRTLLDAMSDRKRSAAAEYTAAALSGLPAVELPPADQQIRMAPVCAEGGYMAGDHVERVLTDAGLAQHGEDMASAAAAAGGGHVWYDMRGVGRVQVQNMQLQGAGTPSVCAHIQYLFHAESDTHVRNASLAAQEYGPPPDFKMQHQPSIVDTIRLFTLSKEQAFAFVQLADALLLERQGLVAADPVRMVLTGEPGTGKSQVLNAVEWFALQ